MAFKRGPLGMLNLTNKLSLTCYWVLCQGCDLCEMLIKTTCLGSCTLHNP